MLRGGFEWNVASLRLRKSVWLAVQVCADNTMLVCSASLLVIMSLITQGPSVQRRKEKVELEDEAANAPP
jgi:hypothetical protein